MVTSRNLCIVPCCSCVFQFLHLCSAVEIAVSSLCWLLGFGLKCVRKTGRLVALWTFTSNPAEIALQCACLLHNVGYSLPPVFGSRLGCWSVSGVKHWAVQHLCGRWHFTKDLHFRIRGQMRAVLCQIGNTASGGDLIFSCPFAIC